MISSRLAACFRIAGVLAVTAPTLLVALPASAGDDGGLGAFFREQFGIGAAPQDSAPVPYYGDVEDRPLIVRPHKKRSAPRPIVAEIVKGPYKPVSIYDDPTLRRGDAVMTADGIRIFTGGHSAPYQASDFVAISDADGLSKTVSKALVAINDLPRQ